MRLAVRTASGVVLLGLLVGAAFLGAGYLAGFVAVVVAMGLWEYRQLWSGLQLRPNLLVLMPLAAFWLFRFAYPQVATASLGLLLAALAGLALSLFSAAESRPVARWAVAVGGAVWLGYLPGFLLLLYVAGHGSGAELVLLILGVSVLGDTAAYLAGSAFGRRPFFPRISPSKTWEGAVAGWLLPTVAVGLLLPVVLPATPIGTSFGIAAVGAAAAIAGDLVESQMKREAKVKDSGRLIPGHGGILDRVDSLLFVAPVMYTLLVAVGVLAR